MLVFLIVQSARLGQILLPGFLDSIFAVSCISTTLPFGYICIIERMRAVNRNCAPSLEVNLNALYLASAKLTKEVIAGRIACVVPAFRLVRFGRAFLKH